MKRALLAVLVLLFSGASAQELTQKTETFEDDAVGANPSESWYNYGEITGGDVAAVGLEGTGQSFLWDHTTASTGLNARFELVTPAAYQRIDFFTDCLYSGSTVRSDIRMYDGGAVLLDWNLNCDASDDVIQLEPHGTLLTTPSGVLYWDLVLDYDADTVDITIMDEGKTTTLFSDTKAFSNVGSELSKISLEKPTLQHSRMYFDQLRLNGVDSSPDTGGESDLFGPEGAVWGGNKSNFADAVSLSEAALELTYGALLVLAFGALGYGVIGPMGAVGGAVTGIIMGAAFGLIPVWFVLLLIVLGVAGFVVVRR